MSGEPAPTVEVVQIPRQRVEASFRERDNTVGRLCHLLYEYGDEGESRDGSQGHLEVFGEIKQLKKKLIDQNVEFREKIVSNLPEAEAWEEIAKERWEQISDNTKLRSATEGYGIEDSLRRRNMHEWSKDYVDSMENLKRVRERATSVPANSSKTP